MLINSTKNINKKTTKRSPAIMYAARYCGETSSLSTIKLFIDAGANLDIADCDGYTSLHYAVQYVKTTSCEEAIIMLVEAGADLNITYKDGNDAMFYAKKHKLDDVILLMIEKGIEHEFSTPLDKLIHEKHLEKALIEQKVKLTEEMYAFGGQGYQVLAEKYDF